MERADDRRVRARGARAAGLGRDGARLARPTRARRARRFIRERMWNAATGTLLRRYRDGDAAIDGYAEDYAYLIFGLLELFQADGDPAWLEWARRAAGAAGRAVLGRRRTAAGSAPPAAIRACCCG